MEETMETASSRHSRTDAAHTSSQRLGKPSLFTVSAVSASFYSVLATTSISLSP